MFSNGHFLCRFSFLFFCFTSAHWILFIANQGDVVIHYEVWNNLTLWCSNDNLLLLLLLIFLLFLWLVCVLNSFVLQSKEMHKISCLKVITEIVLTFFDSSSSSSWTISLLFPPLAGVDFNTKNMQQSLVNSMGGRSYLITYG